MAIDKTIKFAFWIEQIVYLKTDPDQRPRIVAELCIKPSGLIIYYLNGGTECTPHYDFEISAEPDLNVKFQHN